MQIIQKSYPKIVQYFLNLSMGLWVQDYLISQPFESLLRDHFTFP